MSARRSVGIKAVTAWLDLHGNRRLNAVAVVAAVLCLIIADAATWIELDIATIFGFPLVLAAVTRSRPLLWMLTVLLTVTIFVVYALQVPRGGFELHETFFVNRVLDAVAVLLTAGLLHIWIKSVEVREKQARLLAAQNSELEAANAELVRHEAQIARQNDELRQRRREAEEASGRKSRLLASASHDIRSPVNAINLMAQIIRRTSEDPALATQVPRMAERLQTNALSLIELVSEVLDISHFDSGRVECHESRFSLDELIVSRCDDLLPLAQAKSLRLDSEEPRDAIWIRSDRMKLGRVISNLVTNAIKFTDAGSVTVTARVTPDGEVLIGVRDTGIGIAADKLERIFDEYGHVRDPACERNQGWGLGLAICRRLVDLLSGTITVDSEPGRGSVFTVRLPAECVISEPELTLPAGRYIAAASHA